MRLCRFVVRSHLLKATLAALLGALLLEPGALEDPEGLEVSPPLPEEDLDPEALPVARAVDVPPGAQPMGEAVEEDQNFTLHFKPGR